MPAGTRALDGSRLDKAYELRFATPPPSIVRSEPVERSSHLSPQSKFELRWNQPVADAEVSRAVKLFGASKAKASIPFAVRHPDASNPMLIELVPKSPLPKDSAIEIVAGADLRGTEGPRTSGKEQTLSYRTYGPLAVEELACDRDTPHRRCAAGSEIGLRLNNAVKIKDLKKAVVIEPAVAINWGSRSEDDSTSWLSLDGRFGPNKTFTVRLRSSIAGPGGGQDAASRRVWSGSRFRLGRQLELDDFWPKADIGVQGVYLEASEKRDIPVLAVNVREMRVASRALKPDDVFAFGPASNDSANGFDKIVGWERRRPWSVLPARKTRRQVLGARRRSTGRQRSARPDRRRGEIHRAAGHAREHEATSARIVQITDLRSRPRSRTRAPSCG